MADGLPRFAATRVLISKYGPRAWVAVVCLQVIPVLLGLAFAEKSGLPLAVILPPLAAFGFCCLGVGHLNGVLWSALRDDAREGFDA